MSRVGTSSWKSAGQKGPPVGQAPRLRHRYRHDRVSVISALTVAPRRHRFGLYFDLHLRNITGAEVITFLRYLLRHLRGSVVLLWEGGKIHRHHDVQVFLQRYTRVVVPRLLSFMLELNPNYL